MDSSRSGTLKPPGIVAAAVDLLAARTIRRMPGRQCIESGSRTRWQRGGGAAANGVGADADADEIKHPCPICSGNEDDAWEWPCPQCLAWGPTRCAVNALRMFRGHASVQPAACMHDRSPGRCTPLVPFNAGSTYEHGQRRETRPRRGSQVVQKGS